MLFSSHLEMQPEPVKDTPLPDATVSRTKLDVTNTEKYFSFPMSSKHLSDAPCSSTPCIYDLPSLKTKFVLTGKKTDDGDAKNIGKITKLKTVNVDEIVPNSPQSRDITPNDGDENILKKNCALQSPPVGPRTHQDSISLTSYMSNKENDKPNMILRKRISATVHPTKSRIVTTAFTDRLSSQASSESDRGRPSFRKQLSCDRSYDTIENNLSSNNSSLNSLPPSPGRFKQPVSDLDIQLANSNPFSFDLQTPEESSDAKRYNHYTKRRGRKDLISNTVDMWAHQSSLDESSSLNKSLSESAYRPLIFGGTFPIDAPASPPDAKLIDFSTQNTPKMKKEESISSERSSISSSADSLNHKKLLRKTIEKSLDNFEKALAKKQNEMQSKKKYFSNKNITKTFNIDEPFTSEDIQKEIPGTKECKSKNNFSTKTFAIDEPF